MSQAACLTKIEEAFIAAEKHYGVNISRVPVIFNNRLTATAGRAFFLHGRGTKIDLSTKLLAINGQEFVDDTPGHEAAHIIVAFLFKEKGHGAKWKEVMKVIGQEPNRCHSMKTAKKQHTYILEGDREVFVSTLIHNRIQKRSHRYFSKGTPKLEITSECYVG